MLVLIKFESKMNAIKFTSILIALATFTCCAQNKNNKAIGVHSEIEHKLDSLIIQSTADGFKGSVLVVVDNEIILNNSYGDSLFSTETSYWIGSITKQFTAAAILKLQENGVLSVQDSIGKFFKAVPNDKKGITIHHLLTHTSGLANNYSLDGISDRDEAIRILLNKPLEYGIGEKFSYSAEGYNLLAIVIETSTGQSYEDYMTNNFIAPLNMDNTGFWGFEQPNKTNLASWSSPELMTISQGNYGYRGSTGFYSTPDNLLIWIKALRNGAVVKSASLEQMFHPYVSVRGDLTNGTFYGYGWFIEYKVGNIREWRHYGAEDGAIGHSGTIKMTDSDDYIIILSNAGSYKGEGRLNGVEWGIVLSFGIRDIIENKN